MPASVKVASPPQLPRVHTSSTSSPSSSHLPQNKDLTFHQSSHTSSNSASTTPFSTSDDYIKYPTTCLLRIQGPPTSHNYALRPRSVTLGNPFYHPPSRPLLAQHLSNHTLNYIFDASGKKLTLSELLQGPTNDIWSRSLSNELGRLTQGNDFGVSFSNFMRFIPHSSVPKDRKVTYANFVCDHRPLKSEPWRV